jgi:nitrite reductase/ring-hydroxylating ferredoxin subunit
MTDIVKEEQRITHDDPKVVSRRWMLMKIGALMNAAAGLVVAVPVIGYLLGPIRKKGGYNSWISLGDLKQFPVGETRLADYVNPFNHPWDGATAKTACWVRRVNQSKFQVFAINCAHLGCPVRWFPQSELFMCPCHGGAYYANGDRASGPPERGLFEYNYKVMDGELHIDAGQMPTLANEAKLKVLNNLNSDGKGCGSCAG